MNYLDNKMDAVASVIIALALGLMAIPALTLLLLIIAINLVGYEAYSVANVISDWVTFPMIQIYFTMLASTFVASWAVGNWYKRKTNELLEEMIEDRDDE